jgi:non-heme chloroperoxidase
LGKRVSEEVVRTSSNIAAGASATANLACVPTWHEDFRQDLTRVDVPALVIHGDDDRVVPIGAAGQRTAKLIKGARMIGQRRPASVTWTHAEQVNAEVLSFPSEKLETNREVA